ncbi:MAG TPA: hypothetical protein VFR42_07195 [Candidatus Acidoferrum sp.]|nr:hypothetical protein [Candidatus Acidoferrum sp.]
MFILTAAGGEEARHAGRSEAIYQVVNRRARRGLTRKVESFADAKTEAKQRGAPGETFAYWYLRRQGYVFVARDYLPCGAKGEIDLAGCNGTPSHLSRCGREPRGRTRRRRRNSASLGQATGGSENRSPFSVRTPRKGMPGAFEVVAIEEVPGESPVVRLHKAAFYPQM